MPSRATEKTPIRVEQDATGRLNLAWADRFVASLHAAGVREACISPGSRSAPLAIALDRSPIRTHVGPDERSAAFFALGLAKASRRPVAIVCTSGTAAANYFPAIIEAFHSRVPLIVATADRPPESRDTGAPQTVDQVKLYGGMVRWFVEVGAPDPSPALLEYPASLGTRAVAEAHGPPAGPVHLNFAFREPLLPEPEDVPAFTEVAPAATDTTAPPETAPPAPRAIERVARTLRSHRRGLIVCGPDDTGPALARAVARLAETTGYPVFADPASQVRFGRHDVTRVCGAYDAFLRSPIFAERHGPDVILQFGAAPTSKAYHAFAARHAATLQILLDPARGWRSPSRRAREVIASDPAETALALSEALSSAADPLPAWLEAFRTADAAARGVIERHLSDTGGLSETKIFPELFRAMPDGSTLYVGNSMAIRDLDSFVPAHAGEVRVLVNRGANGIDGVVSSALGASAASEAPLLLVTGDLAFHHDLTALHFARGGLARATIVVVNNDGGGIFSFLPPSRHAAFERYFGTPHGLDFSHAAAMYGVPFSRPATWRELRDRAADALGRRATEVLEIRTDRAENHAIHQLVWQEVVGAVERAAR